nr:elevenin [Rhipicephalus microplus]
MSRSLFSAQALWSCVCLTVLVGSLLADAELDCRKYPFYYKCRGIGAKRSYVPYSKAEPVSLKELYNDEDEPKNRQKTPEAMLSWIRDRYGDELLDAYERRQLTDGSFERKPTF